MCETAAPLRAWVQAQLELDGEPVQRAPELVSALAALWPALEAAIKPGVYGRLSVEVVNGRLQEPRMDWKLRQTFPQRAG